MSSRSRRWPRSRPVVCYISVSVSVSVFVGSRRGFALGFGLGLDPSLCGGFGLGRCLGRGRVGPGRVSLSRIQFPSRCLCRSRRVFGQAVDLDLNLSLGAARNLGRLSCSVPVSASLSIRLGLMPWSSMRAGCCRCCCCCWCCGCCCGCSWCCWWRWRRDWRYCWRCCCRCWCRCCA